MPSALWKLATPPTPAKIVVVAAATDVAVEPKTKDSKPKAERPKFGAFEVSSIIKTIKAANKDAEIIALSEDEEPPVRAFLTTGLPTLDDRLGGGLPSGRMSEWFGPEAALKSAAADLFIVQCTKRGGVAVVLEYEETRTKDRLVRMGAVAENIIFARPETAEEGFAVWFGALQQIALQVKEMDKRGLEPPVNLLVFDSVPSAVPAAEAAMMQSGKITADDVKSQVAGMARVLAVNLRKLVKATRRANAHVMFINQERDDFSARSFQKSSRTPGGRALKYFMSHRVSMRAYAYPLKKPKKTGLVGMIRIVKNKIIPPGGRTEWRLDYNEGPSPSLTCLHVLEKGNVLKIAKKAIDGKKTYRVAWHAESFALSRWSELMRDPKFRREAWKIAKGVQIV